MPPIFLIVSTILSQSTAANARADIEYGQLKCFQLAAIGPKSPALRRWGFVHEYLRAYYHVPYLTDVVLMLLFEELQWLLMHVCQRIKKYLPLESHHSADRISTHVNESIDTYYSALKQ